jgi:hypothetical protein
MANFAVSNVAVAFVDLATFDELESNYLCGGKDRVTYFMRETRKTSWFSQIPVNLNKGSGQVAFGQEFSVTVSRSGDYLTHAWLRIELPTVQLDQSEWMWGGANKQFSINVKNGNLRSDTIFSDNLNVTGENIYKLLGPSARIRWSKNLAHNLIQKLYLSFNELNAVEMNNSWFDFWAEFMLPSEKTTNYNEMIGNTSRWNNPMSYYATNFAKDYERYRFGYAAPGGVLILPVPLPFSKDTGTALPCAAIPYNEIRLHTVFRNWHDLLVVDYPYGRQYGSAGAPMLSQARRDDSERLLVQALYATWIGKLAYSPDIIRIKATELVRAQDAGNACVSDWLKTINNSTTSANTAAQTTLINVFKTLVDNWTTLLANSAVTSGLASFYGATSGTWFSTPLANPPGKFYPQVRATVSNGLQADAGAFSTLFGSPQALIAGLSSGDFRSGVSCVRGAVGSTVLTFTSATQITTSGAAASTFLTEISANYATKTYLSFHGDSATPGTYTEQNKCPVVLRISNVNTGANTFDYVVVEGTAPATNATIGPTGTAGLVMTSKAYMLTVNQETFPTRDLFSRTTDMGAFRNITDLVSTIKSDYLNEQLKSLDVNVATAVALQLTELHEHIAGASLEDMSKQVYTGANETFDTQGRLTGVTGVPFNKLTADDFHALRNEVCSWNGWAWIADYGRSEPPSVLKRFVDDFGETVSLSPSDVSKLSGGRAPEIVSANWWANYAIVHHSERQQMGKSSRDILIEQYQRHSSQQFNLANKLSVDIRFAHAVRALFFAIQNTTFTGDGSTYTAVTDKVDFGGVDRSRTTFLQPIIDNVTLTYENTSRFGNMPSEYFTHVNPHWCSSKNNITPGLHMYSYSLDIRNPDPNGHTNYSRLNNVNLMIEASSVAQKANQVWRVEDPSFQDMYTEYRDTISIKTSDAKKLGILPNQIVTRNTYTGVFYALSHTILRVSGGCVGFPLL